MAWANIAGDWSAATTDTVRVVNLLQDAADDDDAQIIHEAACRAGLYWDCRDDSDGFHSHWTNPGYAETCESCGKPRPEKPRE